MSDSLENIGDRLDAVRRKEGLSQSAFAKSLGISRSTLQNYLGGERDIPTSILAQLLEKYSVDPSWMIQGQQSETAMRQKTNILEHIKQIGLAVEKRAHDRNITLSAEERWRLVSQVYTLAIVQPENTNFESTTSDFFIDNMLANNGYG